MIQALVLVLAYILGAIPFGYLLVRLKTGRDVREFGSGNIGATNVLRTTGRGLGVVTLLLDIAKGFAAVLIAAVLIPNDPYLLWRSAAAIAVMAGHMPSRFSSVSRAAKLSRVLSERFCTSRRFRCCAYSCCS